MGKATPRSVVPLQNQSNGARPLEQSPPVSAAKRADASEGGNRMMRRARQAAGGKNGFTLIELLVVIIIIAILAAIAIPTFLGQRQKAQDASAKSLVREGMTAIESAYVDTRDFGAITQADLGAIEPSITWVAAAGAATAPTAAGKSLNFTVTAGTADQYALGAKSASGTTFGVAVNKTTGATTWYVGGLEKAW
jgi:type IV pilus assembly protein PilA